MKQEVLLKEDNSRSEDNEELLSRLKQIKSEYTILKEQEQANAEKIEAENLRIKATEDDILTRKEARHEKVSKEFHNIFEANQEISKLNTDLKRIDIQLQQLYVKIGRYVSHNFRTNSKCRAACKKNVGLVDVMRAIRRSIRLNQKLANFN